jgi:hypothetical protein
MELTKNYEKRHIVGVIAVIIALLTPMAIPLFPYIFNDLLYATSDTWFIQIPRNSYFLYGAGLILLFLGTLIIFLFNLKKFSILIGCLLFISSIYPFILGATHYKQMSNEGIYFSELGITNHNYYEWDQVEKVVYYLSEDRGEFSNLKFQFSDGNSVIIARDSYFSSVFYKFMNKLSEYNIEYVGSD